MKSHSPQLERRLRITPEVHARLMDNPAWRRVMNKLFSPPAKVADNHRINERLERDSSANSNDR